MGLVSDVFSWLVLIDKFKLYFLNLYYILKLWRRVIFFYNGNIIEVNLFVGFYKN